MVLYFMHTFACKVGAGLLISAQVDSISRQSVVLLDHIGWPSGNPKSDPRGVFPLPHRRRRRVYQRSNDGATDNDSVPQAAQEHRHRKSIREARSCS